MLIFGLVRFIKIKIGPRFETPAGARNKNKYPSSSSAINSTVVSFYWPQYNKPCLLVTKIHLKICKNGSIMLFHRNCFETTFKKHRSISYLFIFERWRPDIQPIILEWLRHWKIISIPSLVYQPLVFFHPAHSRFLFAEKK